MGDCNVFSLKHQELASFLQKTGQYDALKVVRKYEFDGEKLSELFNNDTNMKLTDQEKSILLGVIKRTIICNGLASVPDCPRSLLKQSTNSSESDPHEKLKTDDVTSKADGIYVKFINSEQRQSSSTTYFKFCNDTSVKDISTHNYIIRSSSISNDYIVPLSPSPTRYEQVTTERIKQQFGDLNQITAINKTVSYLEVIQPVTEDSDESEINSHSLCDFIFSICGVVCLLGCLNKRKHKKNK